MENRDFHGGPVVKILPCNAGGLGLIPGQGTRFHMLPTKDPVCRNILYSNSTINKVWPEEYQK